MISKRGTCDIEDHRENVRVARTCQKKGRRTCKSRKNGKLQYQERVGEEYSIYVESVGLKVDDVLNKTK